MRSSRLLWPVCRPAVTGRTVTDRGDGLLWPGDLGLRVGAGEGNRTLMTSLEGWGSAIELRPRCELAATVAYRVPGAAGARRRSIRLRGARPRSSPPERAKG
jgi:hypothetical protein